MMEWQKKLIDDYEKLLVKDDDIIYESDCIKCGGKCCVNNDIIVNPYDIWRLAHNEKACKNLGIKTTHDLYTSDNITGKPLLNYYLGPDSRLPIACINMSEITKDVRMCPFIAPVKEIKGCDDLEKIWSGKSDEIEYLAASDGNPSLVCIIDEVKPTICRAFPLGRVGVHKDTDEPGQMPEMKYVKMQDTACEKYRVLDSKMTVREYINKWKLDELYRMSDIVKQWYEFLHKEVKDERMRYVIGLPVHDFDMPRLNITKGKPDIEAIKAARPPDFETLMNVNQNIVARILKDKIFPANQ